MDAHRCVIVDTGAIVASLVSRDFLHQWAKEHFSRIPAPLLTCEAVLSEAKHLIARHGGRSASVIELVCKGVLKVAFELQADAASVSALMNDMPIRGYR